MLPASHSPVFQRQSPIPVKPIPVRLPLLLVPFCSIFLASSAYAQGSALSDIGKSQNTQQDIVNSLIPGKPNVTKGEKKQEVDPRTLQSKTVKDPTFEGGLNDIGLDWTGAKMGKPRPSNEADSKTPKKADAGSEKDPKVSKQSDASGDKEKVVKPKDAGGDGGQKKDQKATPAATGEKPSEKEKASASKADGDR